MGEAAPTAEPDAYAARTRRRLTIAAITAVVALFSGLTGLVFDFFPGLRPDPRLNRVATLSVFAVERGVSERDYLERTVHGAAELRHWLDRERRAGRLEQAGELIYVEANVQGFKRQSVTLRWSAYDAAHAKRLELGDQGSDLLGATRTLQAPTDRSVQLLWLPPLLDNSRRYFVRVQAEDSSRVILAVADSRPFRGLRPPAPS